MGKRQRSETKKQKTEKAESETEYQEEEDAFDEGDVNFDVDNSESEAEDSDDDQSSVASKDSFGDEDGEDMMELDQGNLESSPYRKLGSICRVKLLIGGSL